MNTTVLITRLSNLSWMQHYEEYITILNNQHSCINYHLKKYNIIISLTKFLLLITLMLLLQQKLEAKIERIFFFKMKSSAERQIIIPTDQPWSGKCG